ncbi:hypothetical protein HGM15179_014775 [Zosterops borbonicus]|uniref:BRICHOS domain-containing protein n=1 Tax=Zosterops borbonicus TaxID=364589 RepID=A0A8K1G6F8_9PASS|nr:hypothetical protein HGM15179_014775 [Zosterops borbonicus]
MSEILRVDFDSQIVIASLLGVFLAPALASHNMENNFNSENSNHSEIRVRTNLKDRSEAWKTIWDFKTGYVATKVFSKNTCIIATTSKRFWLGKHFSTPPQGDKILTAVLLGLVLTPALADYSQQTNQNQQIIFDGGTHITITGISQGVKINSQTRVAIIEQKSKNLSWKTIWNYRTGVIATKLTQQNTCYISIMNRTEMPSFDNLARLAQESRNGHVTSGRVSSL